MQDLIHGRFEILKNKQNPKFAKYAVEYLKSVTWKKNYNRTITSVNHLVKYFGEKKLSEVNSQDFINCRTMLLQTVGPAPVNRENTCLFRILNIAVNSDEYLIDNYPLKSIHQFKESPAEKGIDLDNHPEKDRNQHIFTGMRNQPLKSICNPLDRTFKDAGIEARPFHTFRHLGTKSIFEAGNYPAAIQKVGR